MTARDVWHDPETAREDYMASRPEYSTITRPRPIPAPVVPVRRRPFPWVGALTVFLTAEVLFAVALLMQQDRPMSPVRSWLFILVLFAGLIFWTTLCAIVTTAVERFAKPPTSIRPHMIRSRSVRRRALRWWVTNLAFLTVVAVVTYWVGLAIVNIERF